MKAEHFIKIEQQLMLHWNGITPAEVASLCSVSNRQAIRMIDELSDYLPIISEFDSTGRKRIRINIRSRITELRERYGISV